MCCCQGFVEQQANGEQLNNLTGIGAVRLIDCTIAPQSSVPLRLLASLTPPLRQFHTKGFRLSMGGSWLLLAYPFTGSQFKRFNVAQADQQASDIWSWPNRLMCNCAQLPAASPNNWELPLLAVVVKPDWFPPWSNWESWSMQDWNLELSRKSWLFASLHNWVVLLQPDS